MVFIIWALLVLFCLVLLFLLWDVGEGREMERKGERGRGRETDF